MSEEGSQISVNEMQATGIIFLMNAIYKLLNWQHDMSLAKRKLGIVVCICGVRSAHLIFAAQNNFMEGTGSATINNAAYPKHRLCDNCS